MKKLISIFLFSLLTLCFVNAVIAGGWIKPRAGTTSNISSTFWSSSILKSCDDGEMCNKLIFDDKLLAQRGDFSNWSEAIDISKFTFDDDAPQRTRLNLVCALGNNHNGRSAARGRGSITLTYQLSNDGSGWFSPISDTDSGTGYFDYLDRKYGIFGISQTCGWGGGIIRAGFEPSSGKWLKLTNTQYDRAVMPGWVAPITWTTSVISTTAFGGAGPYVPTLTANKTISVQKAKFIRFRAKNTGGGYRGSSADDAPVVFDLQVLGE